MTSPLTDYELTPFIVPDLGDPFDVLDSKITEYLASYHKEKDSVICWQNSQQAIIGLEITPLDKSSDVNEFCSQWLNAASLITFITELRLKTSMFKQVSNPTPISFPTSSWPLVRNSGVSVIYKASRGLRISYSVSYAVESALLGADVFVLLTMQVKDFLFYFLYSF